MGLGLGFLLLAAQTFLSVLLGFLNNSCLLIADEACRPSDLRKLCRNGNVGEPTIVLNLVVNTAKENKRVRREDILQKISPPPVFA